MTEPGDGVIVAVFQTNLVGTDEANTQTVQVFPTEAVVDRPGSMHDTIRPVLEDRYGTVEDLHCHPEHVRDLDGDDDD